jgi:exopolysaccharide production protein ExoZ
MPLLKTRGAPRTILPIQYLRGIAALMVVWFHAVGQVPGMDTFFASRFGGSGIDLFFVISGFIMTVTTQSAPVTATEFMRRRIVRVVPLYWLLTLAMVALWWCVPALFKTLLVTPLTLAQSLLFIPHFSHSFPQNAWPLLVPGWTLNYEMFFYLVFALSLLVSTRWRFPMLALTLGGLVAAGYALGPFENAVLRTYTNSILLEFMAGALLGLWWGRPHSEPPVIVSTLAVASGFAFMLLRNSPPFDHFNQMLGAVLVVFGALNAAYAHWDSRVLRGLGDSSYSLYLTHIFTLGAFRSLWTRVVPETTNILLASLYMLMALAASAAVGYLAFKWLETPMLQTLNRKTKKAPKFQPT